MKKDENIYEKLKIGNSTEEIGEELNASIPAEIADAELGTSNSTEEINEAKTKNAEEEEGESMVYNEESEEAFDIESASIDAPANETDDSLSQENAPMLDAPLYQDSDTLPLFSDDGVYTETDLFGEEHIASEGENDNVAALWSVEYASEYQALLILKGVLHRSAVNYRVSEEEGGYDKHSRKSEYEQLNKVKQRVDSSWLFLGLLFCRFGISVF